jgi:glycosyltransferase involved in cell wall biosynthesis
MNSKAETGDKLILLSMVKNESKIIERLMNSVKGRVDAIVICDTGSTDDTVERVSTWMKANDISGATYTFPFTNFGASRTKSFLCCQDWVKEVGWDAEKTWALLLDGDMMLSDVINRDRLAALNPNTAGVSLKQSSGNLVYTNMRIIRCSESWICKGATHEAWTCPQNRNTTQFDSPVLIDHGDGGCKSDKYPRDIRLLKEDLNFLPNDARTLFYLGQTYLCMRDWPNAIVTLKQRIALGGWDEELYISRVYLGESYENSGEIVMALATYLDAWQNRIHRTEGAMKAIRLYRRQAKSQTLAMLVWERVFSIQFGENFELGVKAGKPAVNNDILFVNSRDMKHDFWEELAILGFYTDRRKQTWLQLDQLDLKGSLSWHEYNGLFGQMHWYDWCLKPRRYTRFQIPVEKLPWAKEDQATCWQPFNPSIRKKMDGSGYTLNLRYANYYTAEAKHYHYRGFHGQVLTRNCLLDIPKEAGWNNPQSLEEIKISDEFKQHDHYIRGVEDCRLIQGTDVMEFLGTSQSYSKDKSNKIFHVWQTPPSWSLKQMPLPPGVNPGDTQKNWLGFQYKGELHYIYNFSPFKVCNAAGIPLPSNTNTSLNLKEYRGSAGPVPWTGSNGFQESYLCVMHKVYIGNEGRRYYHRFMTLDADLNPSRVSCFVRFTKERVEYWSGMCASTEGDSYWITHGVKDSEAYIAEMLASDIEPLLMYNMKTGEIKPTSERLAVIG